MSRTFEQHAEAARIREISRILRNEHWDIPSYLQTTPEGWAMRFDQVEIEKKFQIVRTGRAAALTLGSALPSEGAVVNFPVSVMAPATRGDHDDHPWCMWLSHEPGGVFPVGVTRVDYSAEILGVKVTGCFFVVVGQTEKAVPEASYNLSGPSDEVLDVSWAANLPHNLFVPVQTAAEMSRRLERAKKLARDNREQLFATAYPLLHQIVEKLRPSIRVRLNVISVEDVMAVGLRTVDRMIDIFTSPDRATKGKTTWAHAIIQNCGRDMVRAIRSLDGVSQAISEIRTRIDAAATDGHPLRTPEEVVKVMTVEREARKLAAHPRYRRTDKAKLLALATEQYEQGELKPACSLNQAETALGMPRVTSLNAPIGNDQDDIGTIHAAEVDPRLEQVTNDYCDIVEEIAKLGDISHDGVQTLRTLVEGDFLVEMDNADTAVKFRRVVKAFLRPFALGDRLTTQESMRLVQNRAMVKLFPNGRMLTGEAFREAWYQGVTAEEAATIDAELLAS